MATITGCVLGDRYYTNISDDRWRKIRFNHQITNCYCCYSRFDVGCIETQGEHAGMVKITSYGGLCDDTYYGCVNENGYFQIEVPDSCGLSIDVEFEEIQDGGCAWNSGNPARYVYSSGYASLINGRHTLQQVSAGSCNFEKIILLSDPTGTTYLGSDRNCSLNYCTAYPGFCNNGCPGCGLNGYCWYDRKIIAVKITAQVGSSGVYIEVKYILATYLKPWDGCGCPQCKSRIGDIDEVTCDAEHENWDGYKHEGGYVNPWLYRCRNTALRGQPANWQWIQDPAHWDGFFTTTINYNTGESCGDTENTSNLPTIIGYDVPWVTGGIARVYRT